MTKTNDYDPGDFSPALKPDRLYSGDNGRVFCGALRCAGNSAHFSGYTIAGQRVVALTDDDNAYWVREVGRPASCEGCGLVHTPASAPKRKRPRRGAR